MKAAELKKKKRREQTREAMRRFVQKRREQGIVQTSVWIPASRREELIQWCREACDQHTGQEPA